LIDSETLSGLAHTAAVILPIIAGAFGVKWQQARGQMGDIGNKAVKLQKLIKVIHDAVADDKITMAEQKAIVKAILALSETEEVEKKPWGL